VAADGHCYERRAIEHWLSSGHHTSPLTGGRLPHRMLIPNHRLRAIIQDYMKRLPHIQREHQIRVDLDLAIRLREEAIQAMMDKDRRQQDGAGPSHDGYSSGQSHQRDSASSSAPVTSHGQPAATSLVGLVTSFWKLWQPQSQSTDSSSSGSAIATPLKPTAPAAAMNHDPFTTPMLTLEQQRRAMPQRLVTPSYSSSPSSSASSSSVFPRVGSATPIGPNGAVSTSARPTAERIAGMQGAIASAPVEVSHIEAMGLLNRPDLGDMDLSSVLGIMEAHQADASVMERACRGLGLRLGFNDEEQKSIARLGGIDLLLEVMRHHKMNVAVVKQACGALGSLAFNDENKESIARLGGIDLLLEVMRHHKMNAGMMEDACCALCGLALNDDNRESIARLGGIDVLLEVMRHHKTDADVMKMTCSLLGRLVHNDEEQKSIARLGGIDVLLEVVRHHKMKAGVMQPACSVLGSLAFNDENKESIARLGGIDLLREVKRTHEANHGISSKVDVVLSRIR